MKDEVVVLRRLSDYSHLSVLGQPVSYLLLDQQHLRVGPAIQRLVHELARREQVGQAALELVLLGACIARKGN